MGVNLHVWSDMKATIINTLALIVGAMMVPALFMLAMYLVDTPSTDECPPAYPNCIMYEGNWGNTIMCPYEGSATNPLYISQCQRR